MKYAYELQVANNKLPAEVDRDTAIKWVSNELNENILNLERVDWILLAAIANKLADDDGPFTYLYLGYDYYDILTKFADLVVTGTSAHWTSFQHMCLALYEVQKRAPAL